MIKKMFFLLGLIIFFSFIRLSTAHATPLSNKMFKETYPGKDKSYYSCIVCHTGEKGKKGEINPYGLSLNLKEKEILTLEKLKAAESLDPDADGVSSVKEIEAGTLPGDPKSVPSN